MNKALGRPKLRRRSALKAIGLAAVVPDPFFNILAPGPLPAIEERGGSTLKLRKDFSVRTPGMAVTVTWASDGSAFAAASDYGGVLTVWDKSGRQISRIQRWGGGPALTSCLAFLKGASELAFYPPANVDDTVALCVWDVASGKIIGQLTGPKPGRYHVANGFKFVADSVETGILAGATMGVGTNVFTYRTEDLEPVATAEVPHGAFSLGLFGGGRLIAVGSNRGLVVVLDALKGTTVATIQAYPESKFGDLFVGAVAGSPDGEFLSVGPGQVNPSGLDQKLPEARAWWTSVQSVRLFRVRDGREIARLPLQIPDFWQAGWDPKGRYIAFLDHAGELFFWEPFKARGRYSKVTLPTRSMAFALSPDGNRIAATSTSGVDVFTISQ